jgi:uncharacterized protein
MKVPERSPLLARRVIFPYLSYVPATPLLIPQFGTPCYHFFTMAVNPELLKILVCPLCKASLEITNSGQGLKCTTCHRVYPIRDDIPVMMISEAKIEN